jgi:phage major head subunit gpT-like protein
MYGYFWEAYPEVPPMYEQLFDVVQSDAAYERFTSAIGLGELLEKPEGEDIQADAPMESYTIVVKNRSFARLVRMSYETVKDAQKVGNMVSTLVGSWGRMLPITKEKFYAKFFNYGAYTAGHDVFNNTITGVITDASGALTYDGKAFFATDHPDRVGNSYANYTSSRSLTQANLETTWLTFHNTNNRDERGQIIALGADTLLIPPALRFTAQVILQTTLIPGSMDNDINVMRAIVAPVEWAYLTDTDGWFLGARKQGLMATNREDVTLDFWQDETSKDYFASIFTRFGGGVTNFRYWYACNISSS